MFALVTGANGFIGSHLVDELLRRNARVRCLVRRSADLGFLPKDRVELVFGDLTEASGLSDLICDVEVVFHLAALVRAPSEEVYERVNVRAAERLYRSCSCAGSVARFVFCSSLAAAGPSYEGVPLTEESPLRPITAYGRSKARAEDLLASIPGPPLTVIRPPAVYGPRERNILMYFKMASRGLVFRLGCRDRHLSLVHARDVARAMADAAESTGGVGTFFVNDGPPHSWRELADILASSAQRRTLRVTAPDAAVKAAAALVEAAARLFGSYPAFNREKALDLTAPGWTCSCAKAERDFGYKPSVPLNSGIPETFDWYRRNGWL